MRQSCIFTLIEARKRIAAETYSTHTYHFWRAITV